LLRISILAIPFDGDKCDNARHEKLFSFWSAMEQREGIQAALEHCATYGEPFPISDLLHLAKNWRSRLMKHRLAVVVTGSFGATFSSANVQSVIETLGPRPRLTDESQIAKMRDVYPIAIFRFEHLLT
jgi:hypothetical protein